jgi:hypothetical protein
VKHSGSSLETTSKTEALPEQPYGARALGAGILSDVDRCAVSVDLAAEETLSKSGQVENPPVIDADWTAFTRGRHL